ncbi:ubiquinol-cytochrome c reductase [bacterium SCSIO 12696]|nr:ubiquinol-cytochrome c reductase [bacterium SCSIO 12696]
MSKLAQFGEWIDSRMPMLQVEWNKHMAQYYAPKNFNFWYFFGVLSLLVLVNQILTGIWLTMQYSPTAEDAFASVEYIMRDVDWGWLIRYMHSTGASMFFVVVYLHMFRGLIYGSYKAPRELVWIFGMAIYLVLMAEAIMGYVLPWGQMSYWGAQVIVSLFGAIPHVGEGLVEWVRGDFLISGATLNRFFALHVVALPLVLLGLVVMHIFALHEVGSNNPDGVEIKKNKDENGKPLDGIPFHPYFTVHDLVPVVVFFFVFAFICFFAPEMGGFFLEYANFEEANALKTPEHIAPVWYFTPFYSMLRAVPDKLGGFICMGAGVAVLFVLPWLDKSKARSFRYKGKIPGLMILLFAANFIILGYLGVKAPTAGRNLLAQLTTVLYFAFFFLMPMWTNKDVGGRVLRLVLFWGTAAFFFALSATGLGAEDSGISVGLRLYGFALGAFFALLPWLLDKDVLKPEPARVTMDGGMGFWRSMLALIVMLILVILPLKASGAAGGKACGTIDCDPFVNPAVAEATGKFTKGDLKRLEQESRQRGVQLFANYCMGCHSAKYSRYERVADDLDMPHNVVLDNLVFHDGKIGDLMEISMPPRKAKAWFGATPPDLTLVARARNPEWLYTYLRHFYKDDNRPLGVNNKVFKDVGMPHVLMELQGLQECAPGPSLDDHGHVKTDPLTGEPLKDNPCGDYKITEKGTMTQGEFDQAMYDLVNFLKYVAEPIAEKRESIGVYVLLFLSFLFIWVWLLNREYWKDIH